MPRITGADRVSKRLSGAAGERVVREVGQALFAGGELIRAEAHRSISEGAVSGKHHVPSLPGEPPNRDTGVLQAHIETTQLAPLRVEVSSSATSTGKDGKPFPYSVALETGTSKMAARPYMAPATRRKKTEVVTLVHQAANRAFKQS